jgi:hypothetical protein
MCLQQVLASPNQKFLKWKLKYDFESNSQPIGKQFKKLLDWELYA